MGSKIWTNVLLKGLMLGVFLFTIFVFFSSALAQSAPWTKTFANRGFLQFSKSIFSISSSSVSTGFGVASTISSMILNAGAA